MFSEPEVARLLAFRGGTALYKLHLRPAARYSEDIDLVQVSAGPIGGVLDAIRRALDPWLGLPRRTTKEGRIVLIYRMSSEGQPSVPMRLKVEINSREHFSVFGVEEHEFAVRSRWFTGSTKVKTYQLDELLGTKLRALYQRKKGRDLFDLFIASRMAKVSPARVVECFARYLEHDGKRITRAELEMNLHEKLSDDTFLSDVTPLVAPDVNWSIEDAAEYVRREILPLLPGEPWKGGEWTTREDQMARKEELEPEIIREELRLAALKAEVETTTTRLAALREQLAAYPLTRVIVPPEASPATAVAPATNAAKVALFRSLFRGREDVFPRRWENAKKGKSGYSPACDNEWEYGLCEKKKGPGAGRRATCGECPNQAFIAVSDEEVAKHLRGDQVMGVYPLLPDETCWFLAADFDKKTWQEDVAAFAETCKLHGVPVAIERSRSGNGAHAWFFFASPVPAVAARKLGCFLITETMARRHQLSMESYDRLFPNQDTMPKGGFGNLIALPLQRRGARRGQLRVRRRRVQALARPVGLPRRREADRRDLRPRPRRRGQPSRPGDRRAHERHADEDDRTPWKPSSLRPPEEGRDHRAAAAGGEGSLEPAPVHREGRPAVGPAQPAHAAGRLPEPGVLQEAEHAPLDGAHAAGDRLRRGPARAHRPPARLSARGRGDASRVRRHARRRGQARERAAPVDFTFQGTLTPLQEQAVKALLAHDTGVFVAPPGIGKTVVGTYLVAARKTSTLILVHRKPLLDQWIGQLALFLGIEPKDIGQIGAGKAKPNGRLDVAMVQSLVRKGSVSDLVAGYGQVIQDEAHHCPAVSFERVLAEVKAKYVVGLTATPQRRDGHHPILHMQLGPVRFAVDAKSQAARRPFDHKLVVRETATLDGGSTLPAVSGGHRQTAPSMKPAAV